MGTIEIANPSPQLADLIRDAGEGSVVITSDGKPVAMLVAVGVKHPLEMEPPERFWRMIQDRRANGTPVPWEQARERLRSGTTAEGEL